MPTILGYFNHTGSVDMMQYRPIASNYVQAYQKSIKIYHRETAKYLLRCEYLPALYVVKSGDYSVDVVNGEGIPYMVNVPTYLVDISATRTMSSDKKMVMELKKFFKPLV